ncbi:MAG: thiaminase II [Alphaproteobacteria bacterium]|nr:thiaminase II [Alphaproteobacteria bacterium]
MNLVPDYGRSFGLWRAGAGDTWRDYTRHAFVKGLGDGTLPRSSFIHYLIQDYVYLVHYGRAWALGVVKAETMAEMKICAATVDSLMSQEMSLHVAVCAAEGISEDELFSAVEDDENLAYTRYVLDAGLSGDYLDLMAALLPCAFGYGEIGLNLAETAVADTPYREWIEVYAGADYQDICRNLGGMIDVSLAQRIGDEPEKSVRWGRLQKRYSRASALEANFWSMGLRGELRGKLRSL